LKKRHLEENGRAEAVWVCRAVPTGFRLGGCIPKFGPPSIPGPPQKKFSGKQKFFRKMLATGGVDVIFSKTKFPEIFRKTTFFQKFPKFSVTKSFIFKKFCQGPLPTSWATLFYFFGGCHTPHTPQVARPCECVTYNMNILLLLFKVWLDREVCNL
jgi:hypothetical protein